MSKAIKPMLASPAPDNINFPVLASPKLDGIRCLVSDGVAMSRNWKPIPNKHVQKLIGKSCFNGFDGELGVGDPGGKTFYRDTMSGVMSEDGEPDFTYWVFDYINKNIPFSKRYAILDKVKLPDPIHIVYHKLINNQEELDAFEADALADGYEGLILRDPNAEYKHGRSSAKEGGMLKLKRFKDAEAVIYDTQEQMENANEATKNAFGRTERSSHKANMIPKGTLGALLCRTLDTNIEFGIGTGFDDATRADLWAKRKNLIGKIVKYKFFDGGGKVAPRFPVFLGFRDPRDMS